MIIIQRARIVSKKITSDDGATGYDDAHTFEIREIIKYDDTVGFSLSDNPSGGGWSGVAISLRILSACLVGTYSFFS